MCLEIEKSSKTTLNVSPMLIYGQEMMIVSNDKVALEWKYSPP